MEARTGELRPGGQIHQVVGQRVMDGFVASIYIGQSELVQHEENNK
jgi:hypothetical protein